MSSPDIEEIDESFLKVGVVTSTHGLKGEVKVYPEVDDPRLFSRFKHLYLINRKGREKLDVERVMYHKNMVILKLSGVDDINSAQGIRNSDLMLPRDEIMSLEENRYFEADLLGIQAVTDDGRVLGCVSEIIHTGANDVYVVRGEDGEILIPAIKSCIKDIDIPEKKMVIVPIEGLIPEEA